METHLLYKKFDSHLHIFPKGRLKGLMRWIHNVLPGHPVKKTINAEEIITDIKRENISECFNLVYPLIAEETELLNNWNIKLKEQFPMIHPVCSLHIDNKNKPDTAISLFKNGSSGIKFHPFIQKFNPAHKDLKDLYKIMSSMRMPLFLHTGYDAWYGDSFSVDDIESIITGFPQMPVILVHMIFPQVKEAFQLLKDNENVYLDGTNVPGSFIYAKEKNIPLPDKLYNDFLEDLHNHSDRIMYGTDHPVGMGSVKDIYDDFINLELSEKAEKHILRETGIALISKIEAARNKL